MIDSFPQNKFYFFLLIIVINIYGQGKIQGIVTDSLTNEPITGVEIILSGINLEDVSDINGEYIISLIPPGEYVLKTMHLGYEEKKHVTKIIPGETVILDIYLMPDDEAILSEQLKYQAEEINLQNSSLNIKNVITGIKLNYFPDESIPVTLCHLPGVSLRNLSTPFLPQINYSGFSYDVATSGDIFPPLDDFPIIDEPTTKILLRGMKSIFSNTTLNGIRVPSTSAGDKITDLSFFSSNTSQLIEINKTISSDMDADATAGMISINTATAPYRRHLEAIVSGNYNDLDNSSNQYNISGYYGERFLDNLIGVQIDANLAKEILSKELKNNNSRAIFISNGSYINALSTRKGGNLFLDFKTPDNGTIRFNNTYSEASSDFFQYGTDTLFGNTKKNFSKRETKQHILLSSLGGKNHIYNFDLDWEFSFTESQNKCPYNFSLNYLQIPWIFDPASEDRYLDNSIDSHSNNYNNEKSLSINIHKYIRISSGITSEIKLGGKYRKNTKHYSEYLKAQNGSLTGNNQFIELADGSLVEKDFSGTRFEGLEGKEKNDILLSYFQDNPLEGRTLFDNYRISLISNDALKLWRTLNYGENGIENGPDIHSYNFAETVIAGYIMYRLNFGQSVIFSTGIRLEEENNDFSGYYLPLAITRPSALYNGKPLKSQTYTYKESTILPNLQMVLKPSHFLTIKLAAYKTLIRPETASRIPKYFQVRPSLSYYLNFGNPELKNADVWNYEVQTQFNGTLGHLNINAFYKNISGLQLPTYGFLLTSVNALESLKKLGINWKSFPVDDPFNNHNTFNLYTYYNSQKPVKVWGFEVEHKATFRYLPGLLKNIFLDYNFTFLRSDSWAMATTWLSDTTSEYSLYEKKQKFADMPDFFANVSLGYNIMGFSINITYSYQDTYPILNNYYRIDTKKLKLSRLDIAAKQNILDHISIFLKLYNITDTKEETLYKPSGYVDWKTAQAFRSGRNIYFGLKYEL